MEDYNFKIMSCNLNGIRAASKKGFLEVVESENPDIICIQETRACYENLPKKLRIIPDYDSYYHDSEIKGRRGVAIYSKIEPNDVFKGLEIEDGREGRLIRLDFDNFILITAYVPSGNTNEKFLHKMDFLKKFIKYLKDLRKNNPNRDIIICGDFNIARDYKDLYDKKYKGLGFLPEEREIIEEIIGSGFKDAFREKNPDLEQISWSPYRYRNKSEEYKGLRLDYFFVSDELMDKVVDCKIIDYNISDHNQMFLKLDLDYID